MRIPFRTLLVASVLFTALGGCATSNLPFMKDETAKRLASAAWMVARDIPAGSIQLRAYERMHERHAPANVYIAGEGSALAIGLTPDNPVALHLATKDKADNLAYIARPCQFIAGDDCSANYWGGKEYSQQTVDAYDKAISEMVQRYDLKGINLIGYSGGGAIAALVAQKRSDIISIRTVAGIMDTDTYALLREQQPSDTNLNPADIAGEIHDIPQLHFIGGKDGQVPPAVLSGYLQESPSSNCVHSLMVQEATHDKGWVDKWPELLELPLSCYVAAEQMVKPEDTDLMVFKPDYSKSTTGKTMHTISPEKPEKP